MRIAPSQREIRIALASGGSKIALMDLAAIAAMFSLTKDAVSTLTDASKLVSSKSDTELATKLAHALTALNQVLVQHGELSISHMQLKQEVESLRRQLSELAAMQFTFGVYWRKREDGSLDGPFDPLPWDRNRQAVRLRFSGRDVDSNLMFDVIDRTAHCFRIPLTFIVENKAFSPVELERMSVPPSPPDVRYRPSRRDDLRFL